MTGWLDSPTQLETRVDVIKFLIERDGDFCYLCTKPFDVEHPDGIWGDYTIDHVIPKSRGGRNHVDNYKLAHFPCNQEKDDRLFLDDGTLEPKRNSRVQKAERPEICDRCLNGRMLERDFFCDLCGHEAGPPRWPWYAKAEASECDHNEFWCWMCGPGFIARAKPYVV